MCRRVVGAVDGASWSPNRVVEVDAAGCWCSSAHQGLIFRRKAIFRMSPETKNQPNFDIFRIFRPEEDFKFKLTGFRIFRPESGAFRPENDEKQPGNNDNIWKIQIMLRIVEYFENILSNSLYIIVHNA